VSYTWSKSIDVGSSGWFDVENGSGGGAFSGFQNYYDPDGKRSVSSYDIPHFLSMSGLWELPFGRGRRFLSGGLAGEVFGNWQLNGVVQLRSGQPYNLAVEGDVANIGNTFSFANYARPNIVGDPNPAHRSVSEWFNPNAFAVPVFSYGDFGRNALRSASVYDADISLLKSFPVGERGRATANKLAHWASMLWLLRVARTAGRKPLRKFAPQGAKRISLPLICETQPAHVKWPRRRWNSEMATSIF
jgi:hypothetical protein